MAVGVIVLLGGAILLIAGANNYRGHWAFVTGIALSTLALSALAGEHDPRGIALAFGFLAFGVLSLWSGHRLHRCMLELDRIAGNRPAVGTDQAVCAQCGGIFDIQDTIAYGSSHICARCKPIFMQKLTEGARLRSSSGPVNR